MELVSTAWEAIGALLVFMLGIVVANALSGPFQTGTRRALLLYLWHTAFCVIYASYIIQNGGDAGGYYVAGLEGNVTFSLGSAAVEFLTFLCVSILGLSFLGACLVYNILGFIGLLAFDSSLRVATAGKSKTLRRFATLIVLLPSVSFWSSAIGKDSIAFMATGLALWAALNLQRRTVVMGVAVLVMLLVRPHIAGMMILALAGSQIIHRKIPLGQRLALGAVAFAASALIVPFALNYAGLGNPPATGNLVSYIEQRQQENLEGGGAIDLASMSPPVQLFTYLFRPLPFEATSIFTLAASVDNVILLILFVSGIWQLLKRRHRELPGNRAFMWFYAALAWAILGISTANLGISLRQKWMFAPMLIFLFISLIGKRQKVREKRKIADTIPRPYREPA